MSAQPTVRSLRLAATAVLCVGLAAAQAGPVPPTQGAPAQRATERRIALLVGIDHYAPGQFQPSNLSGPTNDMVLARELLTRRFQFTIEDADVLAGEQATHEAIVRSFRTRLIERANADTRVVFWYSGHGSVVPDLSGLETSKDQVDDAGEPMPCDNTLVAFDSRAGTRHGSYDVTDDEVHSLLRALAAKTDKILLVMDCCYSGGNVRGGAIRNVRRGQEPLDRAAIAPFWPADVPFLDDDAPERRLPISYVQLAACDEAQRAGELEAAGRWYGTLTWFLAGTLAEARPGVSWRAVGERVRARVAGQGNMPDQSVVFEGAVDQQVFGGGFVAPPPGFAAEWRGARRLWIAAGRVHGIGDAGEFALIDPAGKEVAVAAVDIVHPHACSAKLLPDAARPPDDVPLRAVPRGPGLAKAPLHVAPGEGVDAGLLRDNAWAVPVPEAEADYRLVRADDRLHLLDRGGARLRWSGNSRADLDAALFHEHCFRSLWEAPAQPGDLAVSLRVTGADAAARLLAEQRGRGLATVAASADPRVRVTAPPLHAGAGGGVLTVSVRNDTKADLYVAVLSVCEDRSVHVLWPAADARDNLLRPDREHAITVVLGPNPEWREPRAMIDRYVAIATRDFADFQPFAGEAPIWAPQRGTTAVPAFLCAALAGAVVRGGDADGYGIAWRDIELVAQ